VLLSVMGERTTTKFFGDFIRPPPKVARENSWKEDVMEPKQEVYTGLGGDNHQHGEKARSRFKWAAAAQGLAAQSCKPQRDKRGVGQSSAKLGKRPKRHRG